MSSNLTYRPSPSVTLKLDHPSRSDESGKSNNINSNYNLHWSYYNCEDDLKNCTKSNTNSILPNYNSAVTATSSETTSTASLNRKFYDFYTFTGRQTSHHHHHHHHQMYRHHHHHHHHLNHHHEQNENQHEQHQQQHQSNNEGQQENSIDAISNTSGSVNGGGSSSSSGSPPNDINVTVTGDTKIDGNSGNGGDEIHDCYILDEESPNCIKETTFSTQPILTSKFNVKDNLVQSGAFKFKIDQAYTVSAFPITGQHGAQFDYVHYINHEPNRPTAISNNNSSNSSIDNSPKNLSIDFKPKIRSRQRLRTIFTPQQKVKLEELFSFSIYPSTYDRSKMAIDLGVHESRIQVWFQNRRAKMKKSLSFCKETSSPSSSLPTVKVSAHQPLMGDEVQFSSPKNFIQSIMSSSSSPVSSLSSSWGKREQMSVPSNLN